MNKYLALIVTICSILMFTGCGKSEAAQAVDDLIKSIGVVTLESEATIKEAERKVIFLEEKDYEDLDYLETLTEAREQLNLLKINETISLISAIGDVNLDSGDKINKAKTIYNSLDRKSQEKITNYEILKTAISSYNIMTAKAARESAIEEAKSLIRITRLSLSRPDSAGGVELYFNFINQSDKVIKYVDFAVSFYNAVGDIVTCDIKNDRINYCRDTGPYNKGEGRQGTNWHWGDFYNWDIKSVKLVDLKITYMDGTTETFTQNQIDAVQY